MNNLFRHRWSSDYGNFVPAPSVSSFANRLLWGSSIQPEGVKVMKTQAWGWLTAAVLAAGLNSSYHNGGLQWAHQIADRVEHNSNAVLALATGRADQFLAEARMLNAVDAADRATDVDTTDQQEAAQNAHARCPFSTAMAEVESTFDSSPSGFDHSQVLSDREQARFTRLQAKRVRIENEVRARLARVRIQTADFNPVTVDLPQVRCPRVRVHIPRMPRINVPAPDVHVEFSGPGPV